MRNNLERSLNEVFRHEGGYVDDPNDPGGATNMGITQRTYDRWQAKHRRVQTHVKFITRSIAEEIYRENYFKPVWFDQLPSGLDACAVDFGVTSGPPQAIKDLQRSLNAFHAQHCHVAEDGIMGKKTIASATALDEWGMMNLVIAHYIERRLNFKANLRTWKFYGEGWSSRLKKLEVFALGLVVDRRNKGLFKGIRARLRYRRVEKELLLVLNG